MVDGGYDVADYRDVDPMFGNLADFEAMITDAHALGLRIIVDIVPNHTSDKHPWFTAALAAAPGSPERRATSSPTARATTARSRRTTGRASSAARPGPGFPTASGTCTCSTPPNPT